MKRITRQQRLTPKEASNYKRIRKSIQNELPELVKRHDERASIREQLTKVLDKLKSAREEKGMSLADLTDLTGMDRSALSKLETGKRANPTIETRMRYAEAVEKHIEVRLEDGSE